jgi:hypothetical protein
MVGNLASKLTPEQMAMFTARKYFVRLPLGYDRRGVPRGKTERCD